MELWRIYKFVAFVRKQISKDRDYALDTYLWLMYQQRKRKFFIWRFSSKEITDICGHAIERGFLERVRHNGLQILKVTPEGRDLTEMHGLGFIVTATKKYSVIISIITAITAVASVIISLRK